VSAKHVLETCACDVEIRKGQAWGEERNPKRAAPAPPVARPQGPYRRAKDHGLSRRQALLGACPARAGFRTNRPVVEGRQPHVLRRLHRHTGRLSEAAERTARSLVAPERPMMSAISALRKRSGVDHDAMA